MIVIEYGRGGPDVVREHLKSRDNEVVYGLMRFSFQFLEESKMTAAITKGSKQSLISKWLFFVWYASIDKICLEISGPSPHFLSKFS